MGRQGLIFSRIAGSVDSWSFHRALLVRIHDCDVLISDHPFVLARLEKCAHAEGDSRIDVRMRLWASVTFLYQHSLGTQGKEHKEEAVSRGG
jgi:hypothetical protein